MVLSQIFFAVSQKGPTSREDSGGNKNGPKALLQPKENYQGRLQRYPQKMCSKGTQLLKDPFLTAGSMTSVLGLPQQKWRHKPHQNTEASERIREKI